MFDVLKNNMKSRKLVLYGMGKLAEEAFYLLKKNNLNVELFIDRKYESINTFLGKPVCNYVQIDKRKHYVVIIPLQYCAEISSILDKLGMDILQDYCTWDSLCSCDVIYDGVAIGRHSHGFFAYSDCLGKSTKNYIESIGRYVSINKTAFMGKDHRMTLTTSHEVYRLAGREDLLKEQDENRVAIGNDVWIGANTFINASKVKSIGDGAIIAAGAVVIEDVPSYAVVGGVPAKVIKYRFSDEEINILQKIKWYDWNEEQIKSNIDLFKNPKLFFEKYRMV